MADALWAPWRMPYILKDKSQKDAGCFLCENPQDPATFREKLVVVANEHAAVCLNLFPFTPSHLLVAPRRHVADLADLAPAEYAGLMDLLRESTIRLRRAVSCAAMNVGFNLGLHAGAGHADHLHAHVVPRWPGDTSFLPIVSDVRVMPEYLDDAWRRLYPAFADLPGARAAEPG